MKFSLFVHMERFDPAKPHQELFEELVELVQLAEEGGFETVWIGEHHAMEFTIAPNPFILLANLAARTRRIRLGTGTVVAPFWHPIKLAGEAALADLVCGGRLDLGLARGAYQFEFDRLAGGMPGPEGGRHLREIVPVLKGLWAGDFAHEGACWHFPATTASPKPLQQPHPPLWIAARDPSSHDFAVANGCNVMVTPLWHGDEEVETLADRFATACAAHPEQPRPELLLLRHTFVGASEAEVEAAARAHARYYACFAAWFKNERPISQGFIQPLEQAEVDAMEIYAPERMRRQLVLGTPETVIARLKRYETLGYDQYSLWIDSGMSHAEKRRSLELFLRDVAPAFA